MKRSTAATVSYVVLLVILVALMPWGSRSTAEFGPRAMWAIVLGILGYVVTRYGLGLLAPTSEARQELAYNGLGARLGSSTLGLWRSVKLSCAISLAIGLASITLGTSHVVSATTAFFVGVIGQQLTFTIVEVLVAWRSSKDVRFLPRAATLTALVVLAAFFAGASNITLLAQRPPVPPRFSEAMNLLFAIPALVVALVSLVPWPRVR